VARGASAPELCATVTKEVGELLQVEAAITRSRRDSTTAVDSPILVGARVWGNLAVRSTSGGLPTDTEECLAGFTALLATAVANSEAQEEAARLADEQAALRRVATLVAHAVPPDELFVAVVAEVGRLLGADLARMI
jgi:GAF domain-containing protein